jgi:hypothetical protein
LKPSNGFISVIHGGLSNLLGVYSGRINKESDLGMVWKNAAIIEILINGVTGNGGMTP